MKVLFITRSFAPDNNVAAKRITMLAKYLSKLGHEVIVIRSGMVYGKPEMNNLIGLERVKIYSYEGSACEAEKFERGESIRAKGEKQENVRGTKSVILKKMKRSVHVFYDPFYYYSHEGFQVKNKILDLYAKNERIRNFDIVISTFSPLGCIQAGRIISKKEHCKWIIDFRDLMDNQQFTPLLRRINHITQSEYVKKSDASLCVSEGNTKRLQALKGGRFSNKIYTVYNGFEEMDSAGSAIADEKTKVVRICYIGTIHDGLQDASPLFRVLKKINADIEILVDYAGRGADILRKQAAGYGMENIIIDHGYLSRTEVSELQRSCDLFLVLSWNTKHDQGILTGKFYEALQHRKPVVALLDGDMPDSELKMLIDRYHLGICYEEAAKEQSEQMLRNYLEMQIARKQRGEKMEYKPDEFGFNIRKLPKNLNGPWNI